MTPSTARNLKVGDRVKYVALGPSPYGEFGTVSWVTPTEIGVLWDDGDDLSYDIEETRHGILHLESIK